MKSIVQQLLTESKQSNSDSFLIWQDGETIAEDYSKQGRKPIQLRSITKSIAGLSIGFLMDSDKIRSIDEPVCHFLPQWRDNTYCQITIRHLMTHTSGLATMNPPRLLETAVPNIVEAALAAPIIDSPGSHFAYNNLAVNIIAGIVNGISGETLSGFLARQLFQPLNIEDIEWASDGVGNNYAHAGLQMNASDLCKIGQLILNNGKWEGKQILSTDWIIQSARTRQSHLVNSGLLWWLCPNDYGEPVRYANSNGDFGQWLIVDFVNCSVVVRQIHLENFLSDEHGYWSLLRLIMQDK